MSQVLPAKNSYPMVADREYHWLNEAKYVAEQTTDVEIVVDISAVDQIRSAELNQLIRLHLELKGQERTLVLEHAQHQLWEIFMLTRLNRLIEIRDPQEKAC